MKGRNFTEEDWRLFRKKVPEWQESYIGKLNREYIQLLSENCTPSEKFWNLEKRIKEDKHKAGVYLELRRSTLIGNVVQLINEGVISMGDLDDFSDEFKNTVCTVSGAYCCERQIDCED